MKRFSLVLLAVCLLLSLAGCAGRTKAEPVTRVTPEAEAPDIPAPAEEPEDTPAPTDTPEPWGSTADSGVLAGYYTPLCVDEGGEILELRNIEELELVEYLYLDLREDGTGTASLFDPFEITWNENSMTLEGETVPLVLGEDGSVTVDLSEPDYELLFTFVKGERPAEESKQQEPSAPEEPTEGAPLEEFQPVSGDIDGKYHIEIAGASYFQDYEGRDAIRVYYLFTNISDDVATTWWVLNVAAEQSGELLEYTFASDDGVNGLENYAGYSVQPGITVPCVESFCADMNGGPITVTISDEDSVTAVFDPWSLAGFSPLGDWEIEPVDDPQFYSGYPHGASTDGYDIEIIDAELVDPMPGRETDTLRVYFQLANKTDEAMETYWLAAVMAYQDGIELTTEPAAQWQESDGLYGEIIQPGETVVFSVCWNLRTENPVEVVIADSYGFNGVIAAATISVE